MDMRPPSSPPYKKEWKTRTHLHPNVEEFHTQADIVPQTSFLSWWHRWNMPARVPQNNAPLIQREHARRTRMASTLLFLLYSCVLIGGLVVIISGSNTAGLTFLIMLVMFAVLGSATYFNRQGHVTITGLIMTLSINVSLLLIILNAGQGLTPISTALLYLLVAVELFAASLLPANWVFFFMGGNILITILIYTLIPYSYYDIHGNLIAINPINMMLAPIMLHLIVTGVIWLWVRSTDQAINRADRATEVATLERTLAEQGQTIAEQKHHLDAAIEQIIETHRKIANGNFDARVPLTSENVLWQIAGSLNNLLSRLQSLRRFEQEMQTILPQVEQLRLESQELRRLRDEINRVSIELHKSQNDRSHTLFIRSGTALDPLLTELQEMNLNGSLLLSQQQAPSPGTSRPGKEHA